MKLLMVDNYDSFTYNIVQYFGELGAQVEVFRNDEITVAEIEARLNAGQLDRLVISPGPCSPAEAGISVAAIQHFAGKLPILGVCLGHQSIGAAFGGKIVRAQQLMHGKTSVITTTQQGVFAGLPEKFTVNRYHSLAIERASCPDVLVPLLVTRGGYMTQAARIKQDASQVRDEKRIQAIVDRVRARTQIEGGEPDVMEAIYRSMMEAYIAPEHREFARLRQTATQEG